MRLMRLYHFLPTKWALEDIKEHRLKAVDLDEANDLFELLPYKNEMQVSFQEHSRWRTNVDWRMLCLSETCESPLMWGHYADNGKGMCLGFNVIVDSGGLVPEAIKVDYRPDRIERGYVHPQLKGRESLLADGLSYGLVKFNGWEYEQEWRIWRKKSYLLLEPRSEPMTDLYFFPFDESLKLAEILIGPRCEEESITGKLESLCAEYPDPRPQIRDTQLSLPEYRVKRVAP